MSNPTLLSRLMLPALMLLASIALAADQEAGLRLQPINDRLYAIVGPFGNRTPENLGNNATFGFVVTDDGVLLIDSGGSAKGAAAPIGLMSKFSIKTLATFGDRKVTKTPHTSLALRSSSPFLMPDQPKLWTVSTSASVNSAAKSAGKFSSSSKRMCSH